ncbi:MULTISPECIES: SPFH domain-containing protein [Kitasatospora]|uniref:SPFH domain-containing protein n=1 Tax=Kitasatospora cystarginea TaxID=58350 RepID=A0ABN3E0C9_9ACTN
MDVTRDSSPRPDPRLPGRPEPPSGAAQFYRAVAEAAARPPTESGRKPAEDELDMADTLPLARYPAADGADRRRLAGPFASPSPLAGPFAAPSPLAGPAFTAQLADLAGPAVSSGPDALDETDTARRPPRSDQWPCEYRARAIPGWIALLVLLSSATALAVLLVRTGVLPRLPGLPDLRGGGQTGFGIAEWAAACAAGLIAASAACGLLANGGGQTRVLTRCGRYRGTVRRTGLVWVNPLLSRRVVDGRLRHWRSEPVDVTDRDGTPIVVRLLIVWRVKDTARAVMAVADHEQYLREQVHAVLTVTASALPCDSDSASGPALRDGEWFAGKLTRALAAEVAAVGIEVYSVQPLALDYAPEVAESMRRRRLADLDADLRTVLVDDAVEAATLAVRRLEHATARELDEAARRSLTEQLLVAFMAPAGVTAPVPGPAFRAERKEAKP